MWQRLERKISFLIVCFFILLSLLFFRHPHVSFFSSYFFCYPHYFFHPHFAIRIFPSASAIRRYPVRVLQTPLNYITHGSAVVFIWHTVKQTSQRWWSSSDSDEIFFFVSNYALKFRIFCTKLLQIKHTSPVSPACHSQRWNFEVSSFSISEKKASACPANLKYLRGERHYDNWLVCLLHFSNKE